MTVSLDKAPSLGMLGVCGVIGAAILGNIEMFAAEEDDESAAAVNIDVALLTSDVVSSLEPALCVIEAIITSLTTL